MASRQPMQFLETFSLVRRRITGMIDATYGSLGLGALQAKLLRRIGENRHVSQAELARDTGTDAALTGRALQTLLDRGWVQRRRSREDRRAFSLELTDSGEALLREVLKAREAIGQRIRASLSDEDFAAFDHLAKKLLEEFPEQPREAPGEARRATPDRRVRAETRSEPEKRRRRPARP